MTELPELQQLGWIADKLFIAVATLAGAWVGAWAAFRYERAHRSEDATNREVDSLGRVFFALVSQQNFYFRVGEDYLDRFRDLPGREFAMPGAEDFAPAVPVNQTDLLFLMSTEYASLINDVVRADAAYHMVAGLLKKLSRAKQRFQLKLEASGALDGEKSVRELIDIAGPVLANSLTGTTEDLFKFHAEGVALGHHAMAEAQRVWGARYPKHPTPKINFGDPLSIPRQ